LNESNRETRQRLVDACETYLRGHEAAVFFAAGTRATEMKRDVNDGDFDVSLHIYFRDEAAHEAYQKHPRHAEFIKRMNDNWKTVRVFDSWVEYVSADTPLPESVKTVSIVD
jgi:heme-degrading monooxygenase HmoA